MLSLRPIRFTIVVMITTLLRALISALSSQRKLALENLALRQQLSVLRRSVKRPHLKRRDRLFWVLLSTICADWAEMLTIVKPETVIRWHRQASGCTGPGRAVGPERVDQPLPWRSVS